MKPFMTRAKKRRASFSFVLRNKQGKLHCAITTQTMENTITNTTRIDDQQDGGGGHDAMDATKRNPKRTRTHAANTGSTNNTVPDVSIVQRNLTMKNICNFQTLPSSTVNEIVEHHNRQQQQQPEAVSKTTCECNNNLQQQHQGAMLGIVMIDTVWNTKRQQCTSNEYIESVLTLIVQLHQESCLGIMSIPTFSGYILLDQETQTSSSSFNYNDDDDNYSLYIGDNKNNFYANLPSPPSIELPQLAVVYQDCTTMSLSDIRYMQWDNPNDLTNAIRLVRTSMTSFSSPNSASNGSTLPPITKTRWYKQIAYPTHTIIDTIIFQYNIVLDHTHCSDAIRLFVAGDRSSVGKSSICLGILGTLVSSSSSLYDNMTPDDVAYIKPATQSESIQSIQTFCELNHIDCRPIGPLVYYRGFTRAYLSKSMSEQVQTTQLLLFLCQRAVDRIATNKQMVLIDGVGFPAVGSICGTDNRSVAYHCGYPITTTTSNSSSPKEESSSDPSKRIPPSVLLVGGVGVGSAIDAFNLNATYFESRTNNNDSTSFVPVMGCIFNKLIDDDSFYSLTNCREQITRYFQTNAQQIQKHHQPFGFVPVGTWFHNRDATDEPYNNCSIQEFLTVFRTHVNVEEIIQTATSWKHRNHGRTTTSSSINDYYSSDGEWKVRPVKHLKTSISNSNKMMTTTTVPILSMNSRKEIESNAIRAGAAASA